MTDDTNKNRKWFHSPSLVLIPCRVVPGLFKDEWIVLIDAVDPKDPAKTIEVQMFADADLVEGLEGTPARKQPVKGWVRASLASIRDGLALILLPQFGVPVGEYLLMNKDLVRREDAA